MDQAAAVSSCAGSMPSAFNRSITLRRTYSLAVIRWRAAARSMAGGSEAGQRIRTRSVKRALLSVDELLGAELIGYLQSLCKSNRADPIRWRGKTCCDGARVARPKSASTDNVTTLLRKLNDLMGFSDNNPQIGHAILVRTLLVRHT